MARQLIRTTDTIDLVHVEDPCVHADGEGWIPSADAGTYKGATVITIRPLNGWDKLEANALLVGVKPDPDNPDAAVDINPLEQSAYIRAIVERGLVAIDGDARKAAEFIASPDPDEVLGVFLAVQAADSPTDGPPAV